MKLENAYQRLLYEEITLEEYYRETARAAVRVGIFVAIFFFGLILGFQWLNGAWSWVRSPLLGLTGGSSGGVAFGYLIYVIAREKGEAFEEKTRHNHK